MAIGLITPMQQGKTMVEDVTNEVVNVDYTATPFYSGLAESEATNTLHQWLNDTLAASAANAQIEGNDLTFTDRSEPVRSTNVVQLFQKDIRVSNTAQRVAHYGTGDPYAYQKTKVMKELARDIEKALVAGTRASGSSGVARQLDGAIALITTNKTARNSGTSLSETEFNDILEGIFTSGTDISVDKAFTGSSLKRVVSGYTAGSTKFTDANGNKLYNSFSVYESDFGVVTLQLEREVPTTAGNKGILLVDSSKWRVAYLTDGRPQHIPLATIGSAKRGMLEAELTLEALNEKSSAYRNGYI
jgi:hypothetical protein